MLNYFSRWGQGRSDHNINIIFLYGRGVVIAVCCHVCCNFDPPPPRPPHPTPPTRNVFSQPVGNGSAILRESPLLVIGVGWKEALPGETRKNMERICFRHSRHYFLPSHPNGQECFRSQTSRSIPEPVYVSLGRLSLKNKTTRAINEFKILH